MADDAGALLVRSGLISAKALETARARVSRAGGTLGEHLVAQGAIGDDALTEFYRSRLLVPQVNPNSLAKLKTKVVEAIPPDMAVELRAVPVAFDADGNLMVAMGDPSDRHAVDEITFFTGNYVVRAVATQMQIAWCLAHYYGHVTELGQRLLQPKEDEEPAPAPSPASSNPGIEVPRQRGDTARVEAARHRVVPPVTTPPPIARPSGDVLDRATPAPVDGKPVDGKPVDGMPVPAAEGEKAGDAAPLEAPPAAPSKRATTEKDAIEAVEAIEASEAVRVAAAVEAEDAKAAEAAEDAKDDAEAAKDDAAPAAPAAQLTPSGRSRTASGEISVPKQNVPKEIVPEASEPEMEITITAEEPTSPGMRLPRRRRSDPPELADRGGEIAAREDGPRTITEEPRVVIDLGMLDPDRPKPFETSGEIPLPRYHATSSRMASIPVVDDEPSVKIELDDAPAVIHDARKSIESIVDEDTGTEESVPILLDRPRTAPPVTERDDGDEDGDGDAAAEDSPVDDIDVVLLEKTRRPRTTSERRRARRTQLGLGAVGTERAAPRDTEVGGLPPGADAVASQVIIIAPEAGTVVSPAAGDQTIVTNAVPDYALVEDDHDDVAPPPAPVDRSAVPEARTGEDRTAKTLEIAAKPEEMPAISEAAAKLDDKPSQATRPLAAVAAPRPEPAKPDDKPSQEKPDDKPSQAKPDDKPSQATKPLAVVAEPKPTEAAKPSEPAKPAAAATKPVETPRPPAVPARTAKEGIEPDADDVTKPVELPDGTRRYQGAAADADDSRRTDAYDAIAAPPPPRPIERDSVDDGWGPPGTTIPPPFLAAVDDSAPVERIPLPDDDSAPLVVAPATRSISPSTSPADAAVFARDLETAATRLVQVLRDIDQAHGRDEVIYNLIAHLGETHNRAAFLAVKNGMLSVFSVRAPQVLQPRLTMTLDDPSTFQDVVGTRLPYRGPVVDEPTRQFLAGLLGNAPAEMLIIPVAVRDRVVGVLYADGRRRHTFDDHYAIAARAGGLALERILKTKRT